MMNTPQSRVMSILGTILILCGFIAYLEIGIKARNLMFGGLITGFAAWLISWLNGQGKISVWPGLGLAFICCLIFGQRTLANLLSLIGIIQHEMPLDAYNKCIAIIILIFMSMASLGALMLLFYTMKPKEFDESTVKW